MQEQALLTRAAAIELAVFDVDGVLTDGRLFYGPQGETMKVFHSRDGLGLKALRRSGLEVAIISGRDHPGVSQRMNQLGITQVFQGISNKMPVLETLMNQLNLGAEQVSYMGDDWNDAPAMRGAGLALAPADAAGAIHHLAHYVTRSGGGQGAVREVCELLLDARQKRYVLEEIGQ